MKTAPIKTGNTLFLTGLFFINLIAGILLLSSITFFCKGTIAAWQFPAAFVLALVVNYFAASKLQAANGAFLKSFIIIVVVTAIALISASYFYDVSYDGQAYHQEAIYQLKNGWNPYYTMLPDSVNQVLYINHYSKGVEIPQSAVYATLHHIEAGKATNIMLLIAAFCLTLSYLYRLGKLSTLKCVLLSLLITLNPIAVNQLLSYYVDGQLATLLLCLMIASLIIIRQPNRYNLLLLASVIIITANIKFTAVVYVVLIVIAILAWALFTKNKATAKKLFFTSLIAGIVAIVIVGFNPYVVNTIKYQHPFYPLMGKNKIDIISYNLPAGFKEKNGAEKFFISLFSHTGNITPDNGKIVSLKIPFTLNKSDIVNAPKVDTRIGAFGPLFSGILLLSIVILIIVSIGAKDYRQLKNILYLLATIIISVCIIPESWWARYIPQFWFIPVIILFAAELADRKMILTILKPILYIVIFINIGFSLISLGWNFLMTNLVNYQLATLQASHKTIIVEWGSAKSNRVRFMEHHIPYIETHFGKDSSNVIVRSDSHFYVPGGTPNLPKSTLIKWAEKFQTQEPQ